VQINGASLAYGMIRETLANLTTRGPHGPYLLPSVPYYLEIKCKPDKIYTIFLQLLTDYASIKIKRSNI
jgi:hypothetical protein